MKIKDLLKKSKEQINERGLEEGAAFIILGYACNLKSNELFNSLDKDVKDDELQNFNKLLDLYLNHNKPVQYLTHNACFYGYDFYVDENVLIPRFETEELVENILYRYDKYFKGQMVDVCDVACGSGCIGITLKKEEPNMQVVATDISFEALDIAKRNALNLNADVLFLQGDMLTPLQGKKFDIFVSNPPYIPDDEIVMPLVLENEPKLALFGGSDGLKFYRIIFNGVKNIIKNKAMLCFEHGYDKKEEMVALAKAYFPAAKCEVIKDLEGKDRMLFVYIGDGFDE